MKCTLCPRLCGADRSEYAGSGVCRMGTLPRLARCALHFDEEPCISGKTGTGAVFFSGCTLKCVYCQNWPVSHDGFGKSVSASRLREIYFELIGQGARSVSLISGTQFIPAIIESLKGGLPVPVVWNSSGYERVETLKQLNGLVDVYLPDFKYMDASLAKRLSGAEDYPDAALKAIGEMLAQTGQAVYGEDGLMKKGTLIRHLVLPNHLDNTFMVLRRIKWDFEGTPVSLMSQYVPMGDSGKHPDIARRLTEEEYSQAAELFERLGLDGFTQEMDSAVSAYTPAFDLTGVNREAT
ncbi:MAG: 4Fe-4S cluster-binding domain-containing protein [Clostridiales bacterium]|nr:4Fe-4S cluster-binding domain-containing protein [Clostridiales bacterium]